MKIEDFLDNYLDMVIVDEDNKRFYFDLDDMEIILVDLLELAAENARVKSLKTKTGFSTMAAEVDKDSIINTLDNDLE